MAEQKAPKFQEEYSAKLPALALLSNLGWSFLSPEQALSARDGKYDQVVLRGLYQRNRIISDLPSL
jgi:type I restriction enzyme, R subunit